MMLELNYIVVPNNIEIGGGGLSQIFCGRLMTPIFLAFGDRSIALSQTVTGDENGHGR
jgi:hypothetical protein